MSELLDRVMGLLDRERSSHRVPIKGKQVTLRTCDVCGKCVAKDEFAYLVVHKGKCRRKVREMRKLMVRGSEREGDA